MDNPLALFKSIDQSLGALANNLKRLESINLSRSDTEKFEKFLADRDKLVESLIQEKQKALEVLLLVAIAIGKKDWYFRNMHCKVASANKITLEPTANSKRQSYTIKRLSNPSNMFEQSLFHDVCERIIDGIEKFMKNEDFYEEIFKLESIVDKIRNLLKNKD